jgi:hypothetical protein
MPGTFSQIYIQYVFTVKRRENLILHSFEEELYKYMAGIIIKNKNHLPLMECPTTYTFSLD